MNVYERRAFRVAWITILLGGNIPNWKLWSRWLITYAPRIPEEEK